MDSRIEQLIEKYWKCETSVEEENEIKEFFSNREVSDEWKETASLFRYFEFQKKQSVDEVGFNRKFKSLASQEKKGKVVSMFFTVSKIAAGILVLVAATYMVRQEIRKSYPTEIVDTYSDPELAFEETKKALMMISKGFGKAKLEAGKMKVFNEAEQAIQNGPGKEDPSNEISI